MDLGRNKALLLASAPVRIESPIPAVATGPSEIAVARTRRRPDRFELTLLALLGAMSMWVVAIDVWHAIANHEVWTGTDGFFIVDQLQYLSWIQSASQHVLVANLFVLRSTPSDYFQPAIAISGVLVALGVPPWLSLLLWKPVAVVATFLAIRAYAYRTVATPRAAPGGAGAGDVLRLVHRDLRRARGGRGHDARLAVVGLSVRPDGGRADHLRAALLRAGADRPASWSGRPGRWAHWPAPCTPGRAS